MASFYIDGELLMEYGGLPSTSINDSRLYWGDNSNQANEGAHRAAYYESVVFTLVPEPSRMLLLAAAFGGLLLRRRRR